MGLDLPMDSHYKKIFTDVNHHRQHIVFLVHFIRWRILEPIFGKPGDPVQPLLELVDIHKSYKHLRAVDGVSVAIRKGACFGLLGPNGAGKTTLIEIAEDIIRPTSGNIFYKGSARGAGFRQEVGIMFQQTSLFSHLTVFETLRTFGRLYDRPEDLPGLMALCHLDEVKDQFNDRISGGQKQRLLLALALLNRPELVFLDEPSTGMDPQARRNMWDIIRAIGAQNRTIVLTTHSMEEAEHLCDEVAIMDKGRLIAQGSPQSLIRAHCRTATVSVPRKTLPESVSGIDGVVQIREDQVDIQTENVNAVVGQLLTLGVDMRQVEVKIPTLEDVFLTLTGRRLRE